MNMLERSTKVAVVSSSPIRILTFATCKHQRFVCRVRSLLIVFLSLHVGFTGAISHFRLIDSLSLVRIANSPPTRSRAAAKVKLLFGVLTRTNDKSGSACLGNSDYCIEDGTKLVTCSVYSNNQSPCADTSEKKSTTIAQGGSIAATKMCACITQPNPAADLVCHDLVRVDFVLLLSVSLSLSYFIDLHMRSASATISRCHAAAAVGCVLLRRQRSDTLNNDKRLHRDLVFVDLIFCF
jgi:hypothetical protein